jgi:serine/threonine-protein kinase
VLDTAVGPYEIVKRLGAGGMGEVFLGHDPRLRRHVALKRLNTPDLAGADVHSRVLREARAAARLNHPNIAGIYDVIEDGHGAVIVMEYVEGESLRARIQSGPLPADEAIAIGRQLADAVTAAHAQGVIHRDLKPSNVQLTSHGTVKVLDFGVAKVIAPVAQPESPTTTCDQPLMLGNPGTPIYMAPEQLLGRDADVRSDIYSLGVVLFEMATGRRPYAESDAITLAVAMSTMEAPAAHAVNPRVPPTLSEVIAKALEREPRNRYQSAAELAAALASLGDGSENRTTVARSVLRTGASRHWLVAATALAAVVIGAAAVLRLLPGAAAHRTVATAGTPAVIAILPVDNRAGDVRGDYVGAGLASVVATNFGSVSGLTVLPMAVTGELRDRPADLARARRELGVTHVIALTVRAVAPSTVVDARLRRSATALDIPDD